MIAVVERAGSSFAITAPSALYDAIGCLPGARWSKHSGRWIVPATPAAAAALRDSASAAGAELVERGAAVELARLLEQADQVVAADRFRRPAAELEPLPFDVPTAPWRHQLAAYWFARELDAALLAMGMGCGKTRIVFDLIRGCGHRRVLVVAPLSVLPNWREQAKLHAPGLAVEVLEHGSIPRRRAQAERALQLAAAEGRAQIVVANYDAAWREPFASWAIGAGFDLVVADEVHRIKSPSSRVSLYFQRLGRAVRRRLGLSGTPLAHSPLDAYAIFRFLDEGLFGTSFVRFKAKYAVVGGWENRQVVGYQNVDDFRERYRRLTFEAGRDVLDLPAVQHLERTFALEGDALRIYRQLRDEFVSDVGAGVVSASNALARLLRLQQVTSGHLPVAGDDGVERVHELHSRKRELLEEVLDEIGPDESVVCFARFVHDVAAIRAAAKAAGRRSFELSGRARELDAWRADTSGSVLAVQIQSGGEGVDLTRARYCVYVSRGFSLAEYEQSLARVHRPGQTRPVVYVHLIAERTVDRAVQKALTARREVIDAILKGGME